MVFILPKKDPRRGQYRER